MILSALGGWFFAYLLPALSVFVLVRLRPHYRAGTLSRGAVVHSGLLISTLLSQYLLSAAGRPFPWASHALSVSLFIGTTAAVLIGLGRFGFFYALSALLQQLTMTSIAYYLFGSIPFLFIVALVVPPYAFSHPIQQNHWRLRVLITLLWGVISLALFALYRDLFLNAALHAALGSLLIHHGIMYPDAEFPIKRAKKLA